MPNIAPPPGYDSSDPAPSIAIYTQFGVGSRARPGPRKIVVLANMQETDVSTGTGTLAAGTAQPEVLTDIYSPDDARAKAGVGSEAAEALLAVFEQFERPNLALCAVRQNGSAARATGTIVIPNGATGAGTVDLSINGVPIRQVGVASGDSASAIANALVAAVNALRDSIVFATFETVSGSPAAKIWARTPGPRGNRISVLGTSTAPSVSFNMDGAGTTQRLSGSLAGGTGTDDVTNALAEIASGEFLIVAAHDDATNWQRLRNHVNTYAQLSTHLRSQFVVATTAALDSTLKNAARDLNAVRGQIVWHRAGPDSTGRIAAQVAAARLYGDGAVGGGIGRSRGEVAYPAANLNGTMLASIRVQPSRLDRPLPQQITDALRYGLTPLEPAPANGGFARIVRSITSQTKNAAGEVIDAVDTSKVTVSDYVASRLERKIAEEFPNKNLDDEPPVQKPPPHADIVYPSMVRATLLAEMQRMQDDEGLLRRVEQLAGQLVVQPDPTNDQALIFQVPESVIPHLHKNIGTLLQQG